MALGPLLEVGLATFDTGRLVEHLIELLLMKFVLNARIRLVGHQLLLDLLRRATLD